MRSSYFRIYAYHGCLGMGLFWGFIYMYEKNLFPLIISHAYGL